MTFVVKSCFVVVGFPFGAARRMTTALLHTVSATFVV